MAAEEEDGGACGGRDARERRDPAGCTAEDPESAPRKEDRLPTAPPAPHPPAASTRRKSPPPIGGVATGPAGPVGPATVGGGPQAWGGEGLL